MANRDSREALRSNKRSARFAGKLWVSFAKKLPRFVRRKDRRIDCFEGFSTHIRKFLAVRFQEREEFRDGGFGVRAEFAQGFCGFDLKLFFARLQKFG